MVHHNKVCVKSHLSKFRSRKHSCASTASNFSWPPNSSISWTRKVTWEQMAWICRTTMCPLLGQVPTLASNSKMLVLVADLPGQVQAVSIKRMRTRLLWERTPLKPLWTLLYLSRGQMKTYISLRTGRRLLPKCQRTCSRWWKRWRVCYTLSALESRKRLDVLSSKPSPQLSATRLMLTLFSTTWLANEVSHKLKAVS